MNHSCPSPSKFWIEISTRLRDVDDMLIALPADMAPLLPVQIDEGGAYKLAGGLDEQIQESDAIHVQVENILLIPRHRVVLAQMGNIQALDNHNAHSHNMQTVSYQKRI